MHILRKIFVDDWTMKLIALVITLALWFGVTGLSTPTTRRMSRIPLNLSFSSNTDVTNAPIQEVDILVSGDKRKIDQINKNDLVVSLDLTEVPPGDRVIQLTPENITLELPTGVKLDEIQPSRIAVRIEPVEEKEVEVRPLTEGDLPDGYELYSETTVPRTVRVRGPASFIGSLNFVSTERISIDGKTSDFTVRQVPVSVSNANATVLETVVDVVIRIGERRLERLFLVPVKDDAFRRATIVLYGGRSLFEGVSPQDFMVEMTTNEAGEEVPRLILPPSLDGLVEIRRLTVEQ